VANYLVEAYVGRLDADQLRRVSRHARTTAVTLTAPAVPVHYLGAIAVPEDELCFHLYAGPSAAAVGEAVRRAGIVAERIVEAVHLDFDASVADPAGEPR
jgi:hypothetical protein